MNAQIEQLLTAAANNYGVDPSLVIAQAEQESGGNQYDTNGNVLTSPAGALGVMQLEPATAAQLGVDPTNLEQNIDGGVRYLSQLLKQFGGDPQLALAAYDWGPGHVSKNGYQNWPAETLQYVQTIMGAVGSAFTPGGPADSSAIADTSVADFIDTSSSIAPDPSSLIALALVGGAIVYALTKLL